MRSLVYVGLMVAGFFFLCQSPVATGETKDEVPIIRLPYRHTSESTPTKVVERVSVSGTKLESPTLALQATSCPDGTCVQNPFVGNRMFGDISKRPRYRDELMPTVQTLRLSRSLIPLLVVAVLFALLIVLMLVAWRAIQSRPSGGSRNAAGQRKSTSK